MEGRDVLGALPTGAGKSLCYQLPALLLPRPTLVISPLIALMKDQMDGLPPAVHARATLINSSLDAAELDQRLEGMAEGRYQLIYAAPERLRQGGFLRRLARVGLSMVVVDEAHCVGVWGHDFRPDYLFIRKALDTLSMEGPPPRLLALTATATPEMRIEIARQLGRPLHTLVAPVYRPNLRLEAFRLRNADEKLRRLESLCRETPGAAILYVNSREGCEKTAAFLRGVGLPAAHYHAGMDRDARQRAQEGFMLDRVRILAATVAFGMGVDKPNVRLVAHMKLPESLETYSQEAGRAGRDARPSRCALLWSPSDKANLSRWKQREEVKLETVRDVYRALSARLGRGSGSVSPDDLLAEVFGEDRQGADTQLRVAVSLLEKSGMVSRQPDMGRDMRIAMLPPPPTARADLEAILDARRRHAEARLEEVARYVEEAGCRHVTLSRHFSQTLDPCGDSCDDCLGTREAASSSRAEPRPEPPGADVAPDLGRLLLETIASLPFGMGRTGVAKLLTGAADSPVKKDRSERYGFLAGFSLKALRGYMDRLVEEGLLRIPPGDEYHRLELTPQGREALHGEGMILPNPFRASGSVTTSSGSSSPPSTASDARGAVGDDEEDLFERLRAWRRIEARRAEVPPYVIFHDSVLRLLARSRPASPGDLEGVPGIGPRKRETYGAAVLALIQDRDLGADGGIEE